MKRKSQEIRKCRLKLKQLEIYDKTWLYFKNFNDLE